MTNVTLGFCYREQQPFVFACNPKIRYTISMRKIIEQAVLFAASAGMCLFWSDISQTNIYLTLFALICCCIPTILTKPDTQTGTQYTNASAGIIRYLFPLLLAAALWYPPILYFAPVFLYDFTEQRLWKQVAFTCLLLSWRSFPSLTYHTCVLWICALLSVLLSLEHGAAMEYKKKYFLLMDEATEQNLQLKLSNQKLLEAQDASIHVATLEERNRIAREIHDNVGHLITRSLLQTGALETINKDETLAPVISGLKDTLHTAMTSIRESVHDMHDETIDLEQSIHHLLQDIEKFETSLIYDCDTFLSKQMKYAIVAICKEAVNNAIKHSNCTKLDILFREHPSFYQLIISDNGTNASLPEDTTGIGLGNMEDRIQALHGTVRFSTKDGFQIYIIIMKGND